MKDWEVLSDKLADFSRERDWDQFHNAKDLALALGIEAAELNALFLWKQAEEVDIEKLKEELADVFCYGLMIARKFDLDIQEIVSDKIALNAVKYPIDKARGTAKKYNELFAGYHMGAVKLLLFRVIQMSPEPRQNIHRLSDIRLAGLFVAQNIYNRPQLLREVPTPDFGQ